MRGGGKAVLASLLVLVLAPLALADEVRGVVQSVRGSTVVVKVEGDLRPQVGDRVVLSDEVPGLGQVALAGTWSVVKVEGDLVTAQTRDAGTSSPQPGYRASIDATRPTSGPARENVDGREETTRESEGAPSPPPLPSPLVSAGDGPGPHGVERMGYLGVRIQDQPQARGSVVVEVVPGGPAALGGLVPGDVVVEINGVRLRDVEFFTQLVSAIRPGTAVPVKVERGTEEVTRTVAAMNWADQFARMGYVRYHGKGVEKDLVEAARWYRESARLGHAGSQDTLGWMYEQGQGVQRDLAQAAYWYRQSADQGNPNGQNNVGRMYVSGWGVAQDPVTAVAWYRKAAAQNHPWAAFNLGSCYYGGTGVAADRRKAFDYWRQAAELGHVDGRYQVGWMLLTGDTVARDAGEAARWLLLAAQQGHRGAQNTVGLLYALGTGVPRDDRQAAEWLRLSAGPDAALAAGELGETVALLRQLHAQDEDDREDAANELGKLKAAVAVPVLVRFLENDPVASVREEAAKALGRIGDRSALPALQGSAQRDPDGDVREEAGRAAQKLGP